MYNLTDEERVAFIDNLTDKEIQGLRKLTWASVAAKTMYLLIFFTMQIFMWLTGNGFSPALLWPLDTVLIVVLLYMVRVVKRANWYRHQGIEI